MSGSVRNHAPNCCGESRRPAREDPVGAAAQGPLQRRSFLAPSTVADCIVDCRLPIMWMLALLSASFSPKFSRPLALPYSRVRISAVVLSAPSGLPKEQVDAVAEAFLDVDMPSLSTSSPADDLELVRSAYPVLAGLSNEEMRDAITAYVKAPPSIADVLLKTPVGPTLLINLALLASGASYCDLPWADASSKACIELAERLGS